MALQRAGNRTTPFRDTFREHFWITTSGNFSTPALLCCVMEMGVDRILFSVDYPFVTNPPGVKWMVDVPSPPRTGKTSSAATRAEAAAPLGEAGSALHSSRRYICYTSVQQPRRRSA